MIDGSVISLVAGGASVKKLDLTRLPGYVIGINDSFCHLPRCDAAFSMDRLWTENRWSALMHEQKLAYIRDAALKNIKERPLWLMTFKANIESFTPSEWGQACDDLILNGNNSGLCALNYVYASRWMTGVRQVYMFGFDMDGDYWYPKYSWNDGPLKTGKYRAWSKEFFPLARAFAKNRIEVFNCSPKSKIDVFQRISPQEVYSCVA